MSALIAFAPAAGCKKVRERARSTIAEQIGISAADNDAGSNPIPYTPPAMAILTVDNLSLEIAYTGVEREVVGYDIWLRCGGEPVIRNAILKRRTAGKRRGVIGACEYGGCSLLPFLRRVLDTDKPDSWEPLDPDVELELYPYRGLSHLPRKYPILWESPESKAEREAEERERTKGPLPDDRIDVILRVDTYNFKGANAYSGDGVALRLSTTRADLERFYEELRDEYTAISTRSRTRRGDSSETR